MSEASKTAIITGAASGIGAGLAREAGRRGYAVLLTDRHVDRLEQVASAIDGAQTLTTDVTDPEAVERLADKADEMGGGRSAVQQRRREVAREIWTAG